MPINLFHLYLNKLLPFKWLHKYCMKYKKYFKKHGVTWERLSSYKNLLHGPSRITAHMITLDALSVMRQTLWDHPRVSFGQICSTNKTYKSVSLLKRRFTPILKQNHGRHGALSMTLSRATTQTLKSPKLLFSLTYLIKKNFGQKIRTLKSPSANVLYTKMDLQEKCLRQKILKSSFKHLNIC